MPKLPEIFLEARRESYEIQELLKGMDWEGCGGYLSPENELGHYANSIVRRIGGKKAAEMHLGEFDIDCNTMFWKLDNSRIRIRYFRIKSDDWPCDYPEAERVEVKIWGEFDTAFVNKLKARYSLQEITDRTCV